MQDIKHQLNTAKKSYKRRSTPQNFLQLREIEKNYEEKAEEQKEVWIGSLCKKLSRTKSLKELWDSFRSLTSYQDLDGGNVLPLFDRDNKPIFEIQEKCLLLQETFFNGKHLNNDSFNSDFQKQIEIEYDNIKKNNGPTFQSKGLESLNRDITIEETEAALQNLDDGKSSGPDNVFTDLLRRSGEQLIAAIHKLFLESWKTGKIPTAWKTAEVKFLRKNGKKNYNSAGAYRPISLTSCLGKCLERILTVRLYGFAEHNNLIDREQEGFRKGHSTTMALLRFVQSISESFNHNQHTLALFIDFEKAFDSVWRNGLLVQLNRLGISGRIWSRVDNVLHNRSGVCNL